MSGMNVVRAVKRVFVFAVMLQACGGRVGYAENDGGCDVDTDCKGQRVCVAFQCVDLIAGSSFGSGGSKASTGRGGNGGNSNTGGCAGACSTGGTGGTTSVGRGPDDVLSLREVDVEAEALVYDPVHGRLLATVTGAAPQYANELVAINIPSASVADDVHIGSEPTSLALSDDATTLWVGLSGALQIRKVDLSGGQLRPGASYSLPLGDWGDRAAAGPMVVLAGEPNSVAVSLHRSDVSPSYAGVVILDDGKPRPDRVPGHTGAARLTSGPPGYLFGFNNLHTGFGLYSLRIDANGVKETEHQDLVDGFETDITYADGMVFATSGEVIDVSEPDAPFRAGQFPFSGQLAADPSDVLMLSFDTDSNDYWSSGGTLVVRRLNKSTFTEIHVESIGPEKFEKVSHFVRTGAFTVAFIGVQQSSKAKRVYLVEMHDWVR